MKKELKKYMIYILLGILYPLIKLIFMIFGYLCSRAIIYGLITGGVTICAGIFAAIEFKKKNGERKPIGHWLVVLLPLLLLLLTPLIMTFERGLEWLQEMDRLTIFIIYEVLAIAQFITAITIYKSYKASIN